MKSGFFCLPCPVDVYGCHVVLEFYQILFCLIGFEVPEKDRRIAPNL